LSLWRDDRCVETFHLTPVEAGRLVRFLVSGLAEAVPEPRALRSVAPLPSPPEQPLCRSNTPTLPETVTRIRCQLAEVMDRAAARVRP